MTPALHRVLASSPKRTTIAEMLPQLLDGRCVEEAEGDAALAAIDRVMELMGLIEPLEIAAPWDDAETASADGPTRRAA